jgi:cellulose synthase/poly-beta-1,6-N-acetylglucosamine synthase-like glycosyltransferase/peptidoglycan/xylan/chitin deacetylase (PgdA/CDA1 family)/spore germination protein YaaH
MNIRKLLRLGPLALVLSLAPPLLANAGQTAQAQAAMAQSGRQVFAFYAEWVRDSQSSLQEHLVQIDVLMPDWLELGGEADAFTQKSPERQAATLDLLDEHEDRPLIVPLISNAAGEGVSPQLVVNAVGSAVGRSRLVRGLKNYVTESQFGGITIGFYGWPPSLAPAYEAFAAELYAAFNPLGLHVYHALPMGGTPASPDRLAQFADALIILGEGEAQINPGPLASQAWYAAHLRRWTRAVAPEKLVFGVFNQARLWDAEDGRSQTMSVMEALRLAQAAGVQPVFDGVAMNSRFALPRADGGSDLVWMLDALASYNQLQLLADHPIRGAALQWLGWEDPSLWSLLTNMAAPNAAGLDQIDASYVISRSGDGEAISLARQPQRGERHVTLSPDRRSVADAEMVTFPNGFEIAHRGAVDKAMIALTFDDGPDPLYTPQILDILARENVKASFFAVGRQMLKHPQLVERILAEGHEIGSHTYSHTNIASLPPEALRLELNTTQAVFEAITGRHMAMFRGPYAIDVNPRTPAELAPLAQITGLGYLTINMNIDPRDWWLPSAGRIEKSVLDQTRAGLGNIVLFHDGGGDRSHTIEALPGIIAKLRAEGFNLVPVSQLLGLSRDAVMPAAADVGLVREFKIGGFALLREAERVIAMFFLAAVGLGVTRSVLLIGFSFSRRRPQPAAPRIGEDAVGVVIAAYNEEKVIVRTIQSLLGSSTPNLKILVVDDGSTDNTYQLCRSRFAAEPRVTVITQPNGGKAAALNAGFAQLDTEVVIGLDADTIFLPDTIGLLVRHFTDPQIAAVSGNAKVGNRTSVLSRLQALEYITAQNLDRRAFDSFNCITVVPGAIGAWRRSAVLEAGGYLLDTLAEDADLTVRLLRRGYRVVYEDRAIALTEAPETAGQFLKQRFRWMFGMLQVAAKHAGAMRLRDSRSVGLIALPNILLFHVLFPLLAPIADLVAVGIVIDLGFKQLTNSAEIYTAEAFLFLSLFFAFVLLDALAAAVAFLHEKGEDWRLLWWIVPQRFFYRQLLYVVAIRAALTAVRGSVVGWGTLARSGNVTVPAAGAR